MFNCPTHSKETYHPNAPWHLEPRSNFWISLGSCQNLSGAQQLSVTASVLAGLGAMNGAAVYNTWAGSCGTRVQEGFVNRKRSSRPKWQAPTDWVASVSLACQTKRPELASGCNVKPASEDGARCWVKSLNPCQRESYQKTSLPNLKQTTS